jgi:ParB family chromosome partitioning protein
MSPEPNEPKLELIRETFRNIPVDQLRDSPHNPRTVFDPVALQQLGESMLLGQKVALRVYQNDDGTYTILAGHRRKRAAVLAGIPTLKCIVEPPPPTVADGILDQIAEQIHHEDFRLADIADGIQKAQAEKDIKLSAIATRLGVTEGYVSKLLRISDDLAPELKDMVRPGKLPISAAYSIARVPDHAAQKELAQRFMGGELKRAGVEAAARELLGRIPKTPKYEQFAQDGAEARFPSNWTLKQRQKWVTQLIKWLREQGGDGPAGALVPA